MDMFLTSCISDASLEWQARPLKSAQSSKAIKLADITADKMAKAPELFCITSVMISWNLV